LRNVLAAAKHRQKLLKESLVSMNYGEDILSIKTRIIIKIYTKIYQGGKHNG
jgi:hypothetical protein